MTDWNDQDFDLRDHIRLWAAGWPPGESDRVLMPYALWDDFDAWIAAPVSELELPRLSTDRVPRAVWRVYLQDRERALGMVHGPVYGRALCGWFETGALALMVHQIAWTPANPSDVLSPIEEAYGMAFMHEWWETMTHHRPADDIFQGRKHADFRRIRLEDAPELVCEALAVTVARRRAASQDAYDHWRESVLTAFLQIEAKSEALSLS